MEIWTMTFQRVFLNVCQMFNVLKVVEICNFHNLERLSKYFKRKLCLSNKMCNQSCKTIKTSVQSTLKNEANLPKNIFSSHQSPRLQLVEAVPWYNTQVPGAIALHCLVHPGVTFTCHSSTLSLQIS